MATQLSGLPAERHPNGFYKAQGFLEKIRVRGVGESGGFPGCFWEGNAVRSGRETLDIVFKRLLNLKGFVADKVFFVETLREKCWQRAGGYGSQCPHSARWSDGDVKRRAIKRRARHSKGARRNGAFASAFTRKPPRSRTQRCEKWRAYG